MPANSNTASPRCCHTCVPTIPARCHRRVIAYIILRDARLNLKKKNHFLLALLSAFLLSLTRFSVRLRHVGTLWNVAVELNGQVADFELYNHELARRTRRQRRGTSGEPATDSKDLDYDANDPELTKLAEMLGLEHAAIQAEAYEVLRWTVIPDAGQRRRRNIILAGAR